jgi:hypothetical protein
MKRKLTILLIALMLAGSVNASFGYNINGWQLRVFLCNMGMGWNCKFEPPCQWKPCGNSRR